MEMEWSDSDPDTGNATYAGFDDVDVDVEGVLMLEDFENIPENLEFRNVAHLWTAASAASIHSRTRERKEIDVERDSMPKEECSAKKMLLEPRFDELKLKAVEIDDFDSEGWDSPNESERTELAATPKISKKLPENDIINVLSPTNMVSTENAVPAADVMLTRLKGPSKSGPQLIKPSLNSSTCNISYSAVGEMVFNAALGKWQGNESILDDFDKPTAGPNLIPHTQNISGSVGDMVFDPVKLCWVGNEQDARIFDHISQLETTSIGKF